MTRPDELTADSIAAQATWLRDLTRSLVVGHDRADDVSQETLLIALRHRGRSVRSIRAWLARVASNLVRRWGAQDTDRARRELAIAGPGLEPGASAVVGRAEMQHALSAAVLALAEPYRSTILQRYLEGRSCAEIAQRTRVPVETVRTRVKRGLAQLRARLDRDHGGGPGWAALILGLPAPGRLVAAGAIAGVPLFPIALVVSMNKVFACSTAAVAAVLLWVLWPGAFTGEGEMPAVDPDRSGAVLQVGASPVGVDEQREPVLADRPRVARPASTGSLLVCVRFADAARGATSGVTSGVTSGATSGAVAAGVWVRVLAPGADPELGARVVRTDARGEARFEDLRPGAARVETDRQFNSLHRPAILAGQQTRLTITLPVGIEVHGVVVDPHGTGVAAARILAGHFATRYPRHPPLATTDAGGRFTIRAVHADVWLSACADGYAPSPQYRLTGAGVSELRLVLADPGGVVTGRVEGPSGEAVADAVLRFGPDKPDLSATPLADGTTAMPPLLVQVRTGDDGTFRTRPLAVGEQAVAARAGGFAPWTGRCTVRTDAESVLVVRLQRGFSCAGTVTDPAGQPLPGVEIVYGEFATLVRHGTRSGADGSFELGCLPTGEVELLADGDERGRLWTKVHGVEGATVTWNPRFTEDSVLHGRVLTTRGDPVAGAVVGIMLPSTPDKMRRSPIILTDAAGRFRYPECPAGGVTVTVTPRKQEHTMAARVGVGPGDGEVVIRVEMFGVPTVRIRGTVLDPAGQPVAGTTVTGTRRTWNLHRPEPVDATTGAFELGPMPPDHHRVLIKAPGYAVLWTDERRLGAEEIWDLGTIQLRRGGQARVQFDRAEVGDAALAIRVIDAALRPYWGVSAPGDVAHTERLVPGRYRLMVYGQGVATRSIPFAVREGEVTDVAVRPVRGWSCNVRAITDAEAVRITVAGEHGVILEWRIHRRRPGPLTMDVCLAPGRYSVTASADGGQEGRAAVEVVRDRPQTVDVRVE